MKEEPKLIYDIGAHEGEDTSWYLKSGFRVVAVEANPVLAEALKKKFSEAVSQMHLEVVAAAITADSNTETVFHVTEETGEASIKTDRLEKAGWKYQTIRVPAIKLEELFAKYGKGHYCKIDIEGVDIPVLETLYKTEYLPEYFSVEISGLSLAELHADPSDLHRALDKFVQLGYRKFKLVDQYTLATLTENSFYSRQRNIFLRIRKLLAKKLGIYPAFLLPRQWYQKKYSHLFSENSSGPFGEMIMGDWQTSEKMRSIISARFAEFDRSDKVRHHIFWVDLHARF